jgi:hypothetical protein
MLVISGYTEIVLMRYVLKLVGLILVLTLGGLLSFAMAGTCAGMPNSHPCCHPKLTPQMSIAMNGAESSAPCCQFSSGRVAPVTESQIQTPTSRAYRPIVTAAPLATRPVQSEVSTEQIRAAFSPPAQSSLCTFLI